MGYTLVCGKCGHRKNIFLGCGMMYNETLRERTEEAKRGAFGERLAELFEQYPNGCIDAMNNLYYCPECRRAECGPCMDFYRPKDPERQSCEEDVFGPDMEDFELVEAHAHICSVCGGRMKEIMRPGDDGPIDCPECGGRMENGGMLMWD